MNDKITIRVLYVEDDEDDYILVRDMLNHVSNVYDYHLEWAQTYQEAIEAFEERSYDLFLFDYHLGHNDDSGLKLLKEAQARKARGPFIFLTGAGNHFVDFEAMRIGAADYLVKDDCSPALLERTLRYNLQQMRHLDALKESNHQLTDFLENASDLIHSVDANGQFLIVNNAWKSFLGYTGQDLETLRIQDIVAEDVREKHLTLLQDIFEGKLSGNIHLQTAFITKDKQRIEVEGSINIRLQNDRPVATREIYHNITELLQIQRRELENEMERTRIATTRRIIADLSHDLRTPISILNTSTYLLGKSTEKEVQERHLTTLSNQLGYIRQLMDRLAETVTQENKAAKELSEIDLNEISHNAYQRIASLFEGKHIKVQTNFDRSIPKIIGDRFQLERAISNVLENALEYTNTNGNVSIKTHFCDATQTIELNIADTGVGIHQDDIPHIFDHFFRGDKSRTNNGHSGLGLAIAKQILEHHNSKIKVTSELGVGSSFTFEFPIQRFKRTLL